MKKTFNFLLLVSFISGFSIMAMEISASRLLAPYFGTSLFVWTNIIGVVLIALSAGYFLGGKLADKFPELDFLLKLIFGAGILFLTIPWIVKPLSSSINLALFNPNSNDVAIFVGSLLVAALLLSLPIFLLGMVSPFIIKLYSLRNENKIGELSGKIFAVSTIGSILGTFLPTLYLIPVLGTKNTINIFALVLIILGSLGFIHKKKIILGALILLPLNFYFSYATKIKDDPDLIFQTESAYQYISVFQDRANTKYLIFNEGSAWQSVYNQERVLTGMYYDYFNALPYLENSASSKKVLIIGLCGGTIASQLNYFFGDEIEIDGVEIDQKVINVAKKYFNLDSSQATVYNQDGRLFLERRSDKKYDLIIVDAYQQEIYIPWTLTTREFWNLAKDRLTDNGLVAINVNSTSEKSDLLKFITNTLASVFENTYLTPIKDNGFNYIISASKNPLDFSSLPKMINEPGLKKLSLTYADDTQKIKFDKSKLILTDDRAPIEFLTDSMLFDYLRKAY